MFKPKSVITLSVFCLIGAAIISSNALAASCGNVKTSIINCSVGGDGGIWYVLSLILDTLAIGIGIFGVIGISWAGIMYLTAGDNAARLQTSKRRLLEIVIGLAVYAVVYGLIGWLSPGAILSGDITGVDDVAINLGNNKKGIAVGTTVSPAVAFNDGAKDKTYTIKSLDTSIAKASGTGVKCVKKGKATIQVMAANGKTSTTEITCTESATETTGSMLKTNLKGSPNMRKATQKIVNDHRKDFYWNNYKTKIKKFGGYQKYVKDLGGVFAQFANKKIPVKTAADFQAAAEYVFGLWTIWGTDYDNGGVHHSWRGGASDGFYYHLPNRTAIRGYGTSNINKILSSSTNIRTNCNKAVDTFIDTTKLKGVGGSALHTNEHIAMSKVGKITNISKLRVGDIVHFFGSDGYWKHVAIVGEVYKDYVVLYDGGSKFMNSGTYKHTTKRINGSKLIGEYSYYSNWWAFRPWNIDQNITLKGIN